MLLWILMVYTDAQDLRLWLTRWTALRRDQCFRQTSPVCCGWQTFSLECFLIWFSLEPGEKGTNWPNFTVGKTCSKRLSGLPKAKDILNTRERERERVSANWNPGVPITHRVEGAIEAAACGNGLWSVKSRLASMWSDFSNLFRNYDWRVNS